MLSCHLVWLWTLGLTLPTPALSGGEPELCVVKSLSPPDFSAEFHLPVPSIGCVGSCVTPDGHEVHTIRLSTKISGQQAPQDRAKATLNVRTPADGKSYSRNIVLLLVGSSPVDWTVEAHGAFDNGTSFQIIVSQDSRVTSTGLPAASVASQPDMNRTALLHNITERFGCVTSFTDVTVADLVDLTLGTDTSWPELCDPDHLRPSPGLSAFLRQPVSLVGCYHRHLAGIGSRDVYVIEVDEQGRSFSDSDVTVRLAPANSTEQISANITLLLKAFMPVTWWLETERFSGDLLVVTEDPVVTAGLDAKAVTVTVHTTKLPAAFSDLLLHTAVGYSSGPPVAYVRSLAVHRLSVGLPAENSMAGHNFNFLDEPSSSSSKHTRKSSKKTPPDVKRDMTRPTAGVRLVPPSGALRRSLSVSCELGRLVVAVPAAEADLWHVHSLRLADPNCRSSRNATFLVISQPLDVCQTRLRVVGGNAVYYNTVHFVSSAAPPDDEDFGGSGSGLGLLDMWEEAAGGPAEEELGTDGGMVPVSCTHPGRARPPTAAPPPPPHSRPQQEVGLSGDGVDSAGFSLDLFADERLSSPIEPSARVPVTHTVYVRASLHIVSAPDLRPVVEQCWISEHSDADAPYKFLVVRAACPVGGDVNFLSAEAADSDVFAFQVSPQYLELGPYFLHCRVGLCARPFTSTSLRVAQCLDRLRYCTEDSSGPTGRRVASWVQVVSKGPLLPTVADVPLPTVTDPPLSTVSELPAVPGWQAVPAPGPAARPGPLRPPGVPPETVAGVGVAAFVLGLTLMAGVWLIHSRIGPSKRHGFQAVPQNSLQEVAGQSAHSTPSSQTPIII